MVMPAASPERRRDVARVALAAEAHAVDVGEREAREDRDAVVALLAGVGDLGIAVRAQLLQREAIVGALRLLQAQDIGRFLLEKAADLLDAQADRVDVRGGDAEVHGARVGPAAARDKARRFSSGSAACARSR